MKKAAKKISKPARYPRVAEDSFVTQKMLYKVRDELKEHSSSLFHGVKSEVHGLKSEVHGLKSEINGVKSEIHGLKSEIHEVKSEFQGLKKEMHGLKSEVHDIKKSVHRIELLVEEQNNRNKIVLDGLSQLFSRQDRLENNFAEFKR